MINNTEDRIKELEARIKQLDMELVEQQLENQRLLNPWNITKEQLPKEDENNKGYSVEVLGLFQNGYINSCHCSIEERIWFTYIYTTDEPVMWMYVPKHPIKTDKDKGGAK